MSATDAMTDLRQAKERLGEEMRVAIAREQYRRVEMIDEALAELTQLIEHVRRLYPSVTEQTAQAALTPAEHQVLSLMGDLATLLRDVIGDGPSAESDRNEAARRVNSLQELVMAQAAARAYPGLYRQLGQRLNPG